MGQKFSKAIHFLVAIALIIWGITSSVDYIHYLFPILGGYIILARLAFRDFEGA